MKNNKLKKEFQRYFFMVIGCALYAFSLSQFLIPFQIVAGGMSGLATILNFLSPKISVGMFTAILNLPILIIAFKSEGYKFILRCLLTILILSLFTDIIKFPTITQNVLLATLYGGILQGISIGFFCRYSVSSGGTELLGRVISSKFKAFPMVYYIYGMDALIVILSAIVFKTPENVLYAIIIIFISVQLSDRIIIGFQTAKMCMIISEKSEIIGEYLVAHSPRGVTNFNGMGMYTKQPKNLLITVVKRNQVGKLKEWVSYLDPYAFVIVSNTTEVLGNGFKTINEK